MLAILYIDLMLINPDDTNPNEGPEMTNLEMLKADEKNIRAKMRRAKAKGDGVAYVTQLANLRRRQAARKNA